MAGQDGVLGFRRRPWGYGGQVAGFRKDAPRLAAGCFTGGLFSVSLILPQRISRIAFSVLSFPCRASPNEFRRAVSVARSCVPTLACGYCKIFIGAVFEYKTIQNLF